MPSPPDDADRYDARPIVDWCVWDTRRNEPVFGSDMPREDEARAAARRLKPSLPAGDVQVGKLTGVAVPAATYLVAHPGLPFPVYESAYSAGSTLGVCHASRVARVPGHRTTTPGAVSSSSCMRSGRAPPRATYSLCAAKSAGSMSGIALSSP
jgi:hypothetical protein